MVSCDPGVGSAPTGECRSPIMGGLAKGWGKGTETGRSTRGEFRTSCVLWPYSGGEHNIDDHHNATHVAYNDTYNDACNDAYNDATTGVMMVAVSLATLCLAFILVMQAARKLRLMACSSAKWAGECAYAWCQAPRSQHYSRKVLALDVCVSGAMWASLGIGGTNLGVFTEGSVQRLSGLALSTTTEDLHTSRISVPSVCAILLVLGMFLKAILWVGRIALQRSLDLAGRAGRGIVRRVLRLKRAAARLSWKQKVLLALCATILVSGILVGTPSRSRHRPTWFTRSEGTSRRRRSTEGRTAARVRRRARRAIYVSGHSADLEGLADQHLFGGSALAPALSCLWDYILWRPPSRYSGVRVGEEGVPGPSIQLSLQKLIESSSGKADRSGRSCKLGRINASRKEADKTAVKEDIFRMSATTANTTCWNSAKKFLEKEKAGVVLIQEHRMCTEEKIAEADQWCRKHGWQAVWSKARESVAGGEASGGTAVLAREYLGLVDAHELVTPTERVCAGKVDVPGGRKWLVISGYFRTKVGMKKDNLELLEKCGSALDLWKGPGLLGADFNATPQEVNATNVGRLAGARVRAPTAKRGTCTTSKKGRIIDFFILSPELAGATEEISVNYVSDLAPHRPVTITFAPEISSLRARHLAKPQAIPTTGVIGPKFKANGWEKIRGRLKAIREWDKTGRNSVTTPVMMTLVNHLLEDMADVAEEELIANSGTSLSKKGTRCRGPAVTWRSILREKQNCAPCASVCAKWTARLLADLLEGGLAERGEWPRLALDDLLLGQKGALDSAAKHPKVRELAMKAIGLAERADSLPAEEARNRIGELQAEVAEQVEATTSRAEAEAILGWKRWLDDDSDNGHRRAHSYVKIPEMWVRQEERNERGTLAADPISLLEATRAKFSKLWVASDKRTPCRSDTSISQAPEAAANADGSTDLDELTYGSLREASRSFSHGTCATFDGLHPRGFDLMSDEGLDAFAQLLMVLEDLGQWPSGVDAVVTALIPKPKGGVRPIGLFSGLYRLWARARRPHADRWEKDHDKPFFAAKAGCGAVDTVWDQAFRAERTTCAGGSAGAVLVDMKAFYEHFDLERLLELADGMGFPRKLARLAIAGYRAPRHIALEGKLAAPLHASRGVIAGCGFATTFVKIYCADALEAFCKRHPRIKLDAYIDDFAISASAGSDEEVEELLVKAALDLQGVIIEALKCRLADGKSYVVASSDVLAKSIAGKLGCMGVAAVESTSSLGVDLACGKTRARHAVSGVRKSRFAKGNKQKRRLRNLKRAIGGLKAARVGGAGVITAMEYGAAVHGVSDSELLNLQRVACAGMSPSAGGRSRTALLALSGDPTWRAATAPILQWIRVMTKDSVRLEGDTSAADLAQAWTEGKEAREELYGPDGARRWNKARGPIGAFDLALDRLGWYTHDGCTLVDDKGIARPILEFAPRLWKTFLQDAVQRGHERELGHRTGYAELIGARVCTDVVKRTAKSQRVPKDGRRLIMANACNAVWTKTRARESGYEFDDVMCTLCGKQEDTIHHRLWRCDHPPVKAARERAATPAVIAAAVAAGPSSALFNRGLFPHPETDWPDAAEGTCHQFRQHGLVDEACDDFTMQGDVFVDGSCDQHPIKDLRRAGWGGATLGADGKVNREVRGCVPRCYPQSSQAGEYVALPAVGRRLTGPSTIASDCANVVRDWNAPAEIDNPNHRKAYSVIITGSKGEEGCPFITEVRWVKAHQSVAGAKLRGGEAGATEARSNDAADKAANGGRLRHEQPSARQAEKVKKLYWHSTVACRVAGAVLPFWPRLQRSKVWKRPAAKQRGVTEGAPDESQRHTWACGGGKWHCTKCLQSSKGHERPTRRERELCPGRDDFICERAGGLGHVLWETTCEAVPLFLCSACGSWMEQKSRLLGEKCVRLAVGSGKGAIKYVFDRGQHPKTYKNLDNRPTRYRYSEEKHGPSKHAVKVRRLVRRRTRECKPWQETESDASGRSATGDGLPESLEDMHGEDSMQAFLDLDAFDHGVDDFFGPCAAEEREDPVANAGPAASAAEPSEDQLARGRANRAKALEAREARKAAEAIKKAENSRKKAERIMKIPRSKRTMAQKKLSYEVLGDEALELPPNDADDNSSEEERRAHVRACRADHARAPTTTTSYGGASSSNASAPPQGDRQQAAAATPPSTSPRASLPSRRTAAAARVKAPAARRTAAPAGLFGFVAKALGVPPGLNVPAAQTTSSHCRPPQSSEEGSEAETSDDSPCGPGLVPDEWQDAFLASQLRPGGVAQAALAPPPKPTPQSDHSSESLQELLDLHQDGLLVQWPPGLDARLAKLVLRARLASEPG